MSSFMRKWSGIKVCLPCSYTSCSMYFAPQFWVLSLNWLHSDKKRLTLMHKLINKREWRDGQMDCRTDRLTAGKTDRWTNEQQGSRGRCLKKHGLSDMRKRGNVPAKGCGSATEPPLMLDVEEEEEEEQTLWIPPRSKSPLDSKSDSNQVQRAKLQQEKSVEKSWRLRMMRISLKKQR